MGVRERLLLHTLSRTYAHGCSMHQCARARSVSVARPLFKRGWGDLLTVSVVYCHTAMRMS